MPSSALSRPSPLAYPWRLRLAHEGQLSLRLEREGRFVRFDPMYAPGSDDIVLLTWNWPEHLDGTALAVQAGARPTVLGSREVLDWLGGKGEVEALTGPQDGFEHVVDGVRIEAFAYTPIPYATPGEAVRKVQAGMLRPGTAVRRLVKRARAPKAPPLVYRLTFPDGSTLVHLNHALHSGTPAAWLERAAERLGGADWLIAGVDFEEHEAFLERIERFRPKMLLVTTLAGEVRRSVGLPVKLLTPLVDAIEARGIDAYVFPSQSTFRFE